MSTTVKNLNVESSSKNTVVSFMFKFMFVVVLVVTLPFVPFPAVSGTSLMTPLALF